MLCQVVYCRGDESYHCLFGIGLINESSGPICMAAILDNYYIIAYQINKNDYMVRNVLNSKAINKE